LQFEGGGLVGVVEGVEVVDVQFVGDGVSLGVGFAGHQGAVLPGAVDQSGQCGLADEVGDGSDADAVVAGGKIEEGGAWGRCFEGRGPSGEVGGVVVGKGVEDEGGQGEVVDELCFVSAVAEVGDVFFMGDVGFGEQQDVWCQGVEHIAHDSYEGVGLGQVGTGGSRLFPDVGNGVEANDSGATADVGEQHIEDIEEDVRIFEVQIDLVGTEGGPAVFLALVGLEGMEQG